MLDEPIAIMDLKRYASDVVFKENKPRKDIVFPKNNKSVVNNWGRSFWTYLWLLFSKIGL
jgi:hypothetical protein